MSLFRRLFCNHDWCWYRNIYGDEIIAAGYKRSEFRCTKCGAFEYRESLKGE